MIALVFCCLAEQSLAQNLSMLEGQVAQLEREITFCEEQLKILDERLKYYGWSAYQNPDGSWPTELPYGVATATNSVYVEAMEFMKEYQDCVRRNRAELNTLKKKILSLLGSAGTLDSERDPLQISRIRSFCFS